MNNSRVFVVQNQHKWDGNSFVPKFDLTSAAEYGELIYLLTPTAAPFNSKPIIEELREKLIDFSNDDHLLLIGNPALIGFSVAIAAESNGGAISLLQWSGKERRYVRIQADDLFTY